MSTAPVPKRGPGETFSVSLDDVMQRASNTPAPSVHIRIDDHPSAAGRVSVRRDEVTWRFTLGHEGDLRPQKRVSDNGTPTTIVTVPGWLERVLWHVGFDAIESA
jgi:hypothetical protein